MTDTTTGQQRAWWRTRRRIAAIAAVLVLAIGAVVWSQVAAARAEDRRVDELYCTLSGVSPMDRGPETGIRCADLLGY